MNKPIVEGHVLARAPCKYDSAPGVDFTIRLDNGVQVHAMTGRYLLNKIPGTVRFHYSGDPRKIVFLFEYQENPLLLYLVCWLGCLLAGLLFWVNDARKRFGNNNLQKMSDETI